MQKKDKELDIMKDSKSKIKDCHREFQNQVLNKALADSHITNRKGRVRRI